jgi:hypothetical protein
LQIPQVKGKEMEETAIAKVSTMLSAEAGTTFCSIQADGDRETAKRVYNAMNDPEYRVADFINKTIEVENVLLEIRDILNEETGEISRVPRVVLIDVDCKAYQATSVGMFNVIKNAYAVFGQAPWTPPLKMHIKQKAVKNGSMLTATIE